MIKNFSPIEKLVEESINYLYKLNPCPELDFQYNTKIYKGDLTLVLFPLSNILKRSPKCIGIDIGSFVKNKLEELISFSIIGGFLNFIYQDGYYLFLLRKMLNKNFYDLKLSDQKKVMIEYSSPNANKPLHLGHVRNSLIGYSISSIFKIVGYKIIKIQIMNDRGIHICKSMVAWNKLGKGEKPDSVGMKGDHFVGMYYHLFDKIYNEESKKYQENDIPILKEAREMLKKWEDGDTKIRKIWKEMNEWVYKGFQDTYDKLGITFDKIEYESNIYEIGKSIIRYGLQKGFFFQKKDGSIWINLIKDGFDQKLLLRSDGTSVYITQDIGTAVMRFKKYRIDKLIYIVGKEQDYHFKVLFKILKRLGYIWVKKLIHLSYGMVYLPSGKMGSRKGNIIDADSFMLEMFSLVKKNFLKKSFLSIKEKEKNAEIIGLGAIKYYFLQVNPKKNILFDPLKSIDFKGKTGTYIQYSYSRIRSIERKFIILCSLSNQNWLNDKLDINEKNIIKILKKYPFVLKKSAYELNPSLVANYIYEVAKTFNHLYQNKKIIDPLNIIHSNICMNIIHVTGNVLKSGMNLLGIQMLERM
ncbi:arginine--tRNA ligase [Blattabacterium cuenoti]|uniref:arginine--tRNA ligase n=1 Tax=Blattabacterium cuenoti TaxID=1653831 RepID=UPI00163B9D32|nr:arginine--tRNA ligase [Blattabacterium cuenoti]